MAREKLGVRLDDVPEWLGNAAIAYEAVEKSFTALAEDERLETFGAPPKEERRTRLKTLKEEARQTARGVALMTGGGLIFPKGVWIEDLVPGLKNAGEEERQEFYRPHVESMRNRLRQLARSFKEGGKRVPDEISIVKDGTITVLDTKNFELFRIPVKKVRMFGFEAGVGDEKNRTSAPDGDWFRIRWDDAFLQNVKGVSERERVRIIAKAHLET